MISRASAVDPMQVALEVCRLPDANDLASAWVSLEPTVQTKKSVRKWLRMTQEPGGEDDYFRDESLLRKQKRIAKAMEARYRELRAKAHPAAPFPRVELEKDRDPWDVFRWNLRFHWSGDDAKPFEVRVSLDPETFEYGLKPVPIAWLYDERFVRFLQELLWRVPAELGAGCHMAHGGGQFSFSAKPFLRKSLLADDIAHKASHPELATWILDWPNPDDRAFRATRERFAAFQTLVDRYWAGCFHPAANGVLTVENAYLDRGFGPAPDPRERRRDPARGPIGDAREVFQTNFAFGRAIRLQAQSVHPGYWQSAHPDEEGFRPDQIMRYSEGNLNRLQIVGELHVKSGKTIEAERAPELGAPLDAPMLTTDACWESRAQMSRTSARDHVEAVLLALHHARWLEANPHVEITRSLLQDQLLGDAARTLERHGGSEILAQLAKRARKKNLEESRGRMNTDWIEPEALFWAAWGVLPAGEKAAIAHEAIEGFLETVDHAASIDPRGAAGDPMEWHRHRVHPLLWQAIEDAPPGRASDPVLEQWRAWSARREHYLARRPRWSPLARAVPPWEEDLARITGQGTWLPR